MSGKVNVLTWFGVQVRKKRAKTFMTGLLRTACILMLVSPQVVSASEPEYRIDSVELTVYRDGLVHVAQALTVNETFPSILLTLLASSIENVIVLDENDTVLDYEIKGSNMTVFTLGARRVSLEYDTISLTKKEAGVWTLILDAPYDLTLYLPEESTIVYLNEMPTSIDTEDERISLLLFPGEWEISYVLPVVPPAAFRVSDLIVNPTEVEVGKEITISATVTNIGEGQGSYTVVLKINDIVESTETVTLAGGASTTVEFKVVKEDAGTYNIEVSGLKGAFTVK
ncbi:MAG: CARDB domain-containing protein, partial [Candidatus Bathyarchaeia archaeon]